MQDIFDTLVQEIEKAAFPHFFARSEYRQNLDRAEKHSQWLEEHLSVEAREHLKKARDAECCMDSLVREAMVRTALALGARLAIVS